jgi:hypothetical protein
MSSKAEEYRKKADEAEANAARMKDYAARGIYLKIAGQWREMTEQAARNKW